MLTDKNGILNRERNTVFQMSANGNNGWQRSLKTYGQRGISTSSSHYLLSAYPYSNNRVIHMSDNWTVIYKEIIRNFSKSLQCLIFINANGFLG